MVDVRESVAATGVTSIDDVRGEVGCGTAAAEVVEVLGEAGGFTAAVVADVRGVASGTGLFVAEVLGAAV